MPEDHRLFYEQNIYENNNQVTQKLYSECMLNEQGHIRENQATYFDMMSNEEPISIVYRYKNFRLQNIGSRPGTVPIYMVGSKQSRNTGKNHK